MTHENTLTLTLTNSQKAYLTNEAKKKGYKKNGEERIIKHLINRQVVEMELEENIKDFSKLTPEEFYIMVVNRTSETNYNKYSLIEKYSKETPTSEALVNEIYKIKYQNKIKTLHVYINKATKQRIMNSQNTYADGKPRETTYKLFKRTINKRNYLIIE